jgi:predicted HTH domain antitoxin
VSSKRKSPSANARQRAGARLAQRRAREEDLVVAAANAVDRKAAARAELADADIALGVAVNALVEMGFTVEEVVHIIDVETSELPAEVTRRRQQRRSKVGVERPAARPALRPSADSVSRSSRAHDGDPVTPAPPASASPAAPGSA